MTRSHVHPPGADRFGVRVLARAQARTLGSIAVIGERGSADPQAAACAGGAPGASPISRLRAASCR